MDFFEKPYYRLNKILMSGIGQWPYQSKSSSRFFFTIFLFICTTQMVPQFLGVWKNRDDPSIVLDSIAPFLLDAAFFSKLITCMCNSKKLLKLMNRIKEDYRVWSNDEEIGILHEYAEIGRKFTVLYTVAMYFTGIVFLTEPIMPKVIDSLFHNGTAQGIYPLPVHYGFIDMEKYYFYIIGWMYVSALTIVSISIATDVMFITMAAHGCGIFAAVGHKLKRSGEKENSRDNIGNEKASVAAYHHISTCIDRHNEAIEYANLLEQIYTWCFFLVVGFNMMMISVTGLQIVTRPDHKDLVRFVTFVIAQMIHLYIETNIAQILMDHSTSISYDVQSGEWYKLSLKSQRLLGLITMRSNIPCKLTAGKLCALNVETFAVVLKTSMSYFTLLRSMQ